MKRITIIEDNAVVANLYRSALMSEGYDVAHAVDGDAGLRAIADTPPDLVILDLMLPKVDGLEVLRRIRASTEFAATPVIVTSNSYTMARMNDLRDAGATHIVTKVSMSPKELARVVREALERAGNKG